MRTKSVTHQAKIQSPAQSTYPVAVLLRIRKVGSRFELEALSDYWATGTVGLTEHDLAALNSKLQSAMASIAGEIASGNLDAISDRAYIRSLAEVGYYAFNKIFQDSRLSAVRDLLARNQSITVQIVTEDFFLPWELLYPVDLSKPLNYQNFWGMKYIIFRQIAGGDHPGTRMPTKVEFASRPRLGLFLNESLAHVVAHERPFFQRLADQHKITLSELRPLNVDYKIQEMREFQGFWNQPFHIVHFACHASYEAQSPQDSYVLVSRDFPVTIQDMDVYHVTIDSAPLVVMNACETGNLNPLYTSHFADAFLRYGARGVVATDCVVPDAFAAEFAEALYDRLLGGKTLGESLLTVRQHFMKQGNPAGLIYSMYASPAIRFTPKGGKR